MSFLFLSKILIVCVKRTYNMRVSPKIIIHPHPYSHIRTKLVVFAIQVNVAAAFGEEVRPTSVSQKKKIH